MLLCSAGRMSAVPTRHTHTHALTHSLCPYRSVCVERPVSHACVVTKSSTNPSWPPRRCRQRQPFRPMCGCVWPCVVFRCLPQRVDVCSRACVRPAISHERSRRYFGGLARVSVMDTRRRRRGHAPVTCENVCSCIRCVLCHVFYCVESDA